MGADDMSIYCSGLNLDGRLSVMYRPLTIVDTILNSLYPKVILVCRSL